MHTSDSFHVNVKNKSEYSNRIISIKISDKNEMSVCLKIAKKSVWFNSGTLSRPNPTV